MSEIPSSLGLDPGGMVGSIEGLDSLGTAPMHSAANTSGGPLAEHEELLAEALYRRAQAKLLIDCFNHDIKAPDFSHSSHGPVQSGAGIVRRQPEQLVMEAAVVDAMRVTYAILASIYLCLTSSTIILCCLTFCYQIVFLCWPLCVQAVSLIPTDDDFQVLAANCYIRLGKFKAAEIHLELVVARSPNNQRAQFHLAFCQQEDGNKRDAIEALTKVLIASL
jgi:tetratricopeptide (TPR) repeat protein